MTQRHGCRLFAVNADFIQLGAILRPSSPSPCQIAACRRGLATELTSREALLRQATQDEILDKLRIQVQSLKGAVENLGVVGVARAAKAIELARAGPELELALARLDCEVTHAQRAIGRLVGPPKVSRRRTA